jgi:hypothetical protein
MADCPACGEPRSGESPSCAACGTRLDVPAEEAPAAPETAAASHPFSEFAQFDPPAEPQGPGAFGPPATPPTDPPGPQLVIPTTTSSAGRNVLVGVVLVVVLAAAAFVLLGSGDDDGVAADDATTTTLPGLSTTPELSDEEYLVDVLAAADGSGPLADDDEDECFYRSMIAAMGGAGALREIGIRPVELAGTFPLRGQAIPAGAVDAFLAANATCGLDLTEVIFVRPVNIELGDAAAACVGVSIDRTSLNRLIAEFFLDPNRSDFTFIPPGDLIARTQALVEGCI